MILVASVMFSELGCAIKKDIHFGSFKTEIKRDTCWSPTVGCRLEE